MQYDLARTSVPEERAIRVRLLGTGAAAPTVEVGPGITAARTATGVGKLTFSENPGTFVGCSYMLGATTPGDVKGHTVTRDTPETSSAGVVSLEFSIWNSSFAADNLQATEYLDLAIVYAATSEI
jgi:hypothetical protein